MIELTNKTCKEVFTFISSDYIFLSNYFQTKKPFENILDLCILDILQITYQCISKFDIK